MKKIMHSKAINPYQQTDLSTHQLADFLASCRYEQLPSVVVERAKLTIADTIGVGLAGSRDPMVQGIASQLQPGHAASVMSVNFPGAADPVATAVANSVQICSVELDEGAPGGGHPALHVLPAVLAMAEAQGQGGRELIEAFVLGYEAHYRIQAATRLHQNLYPHGNTGTIGTVVGLGKLRGWDADAMVRGIQIAAAFPVATSYAPCISGASAAIALAAVSIPIARMVVDMVEGGMNGHYNALANSFGTIMGEGFDNDVLLEGLGEDFALTRNHFKFHASCGVIHPVLEATATALGGGPSPGKYPPFRSGSAQDPDDIARVRVVADPRAKRLDYIATASATSGKFSLQFSLAAFLTEGELTPALYEKGVLKDVKTRALEQKIDICIDSNIGPDGDSGHLAIVEILYKDGRTAVGTCERIYGRKDYPSTLKDAQAKFVALSSPVLGKDEACQLYQRLAYLDSHVTIESLLRPAGENTTVPTRP